jgi:predicted ATPase/signal transduction histidine kinase
MFNIPNFQMLQPLYESENSLVYRAIRQIDQQPVILKWLKADYPSATQLARYQHEYELLSQFNLPGVIQAYSLEQWQDRLILVLEDFGGDSLNVWLTRRALTVTEWLPLAIQMADSLGQLHATQVIHKDINPNNFVWNPTTSQLKLIDFGIATRLPRETLMLQNPNQLEGTLSYLSPEQTGRMNRALDYRTDLYSLGVTFYELFTGRLPFDSQDAMELVHCHLAKQPLSPHQVKADVPPVISHLILRLLAKAAEERYQSAWGVKADLEQILANLTSLQDLSGFKLGQHDVSDRFHLPQQLYGREEELQQLLVAFEDISTGQSQLLLVAGYSGIGKTALVQEIYKPITEKRGYFIAGKFDQFQRNVPYSAVVQAFRELVRQLLTETQSRLEYWKTQLLTALGNNGQVIIDVISEVELIIGKPPTVPTLPPTESQNRFNLVFQNFIKVFCQADHPLVMFLDDLQWVDSASLKLMSLMMNDIPYLLLIGAYRDNEVSPIHPLMTTLEEMQTQGLLVQTLTLSPLSLPHLNQLVSDTLHLPVAQTLPLAELVLEKTGGNPFFVGEFLKTLYVEQLLSFNSSQRQWQWDLAQIKARNITDNVVELMMGKILRLKPPVQQVLTLAAAIGNQFDLATLSIVSQQSGDWVKTQLWEALVDGLVVPVGEKYKFVHDRVQQAAYSLISESDRPALHWQIGQLLLKDLTDLQERLFEVVDHLNLGRSHATTPEETMLLIRLNLSAGQKAKLATAYRTAAEYLRHGKTWLMPAHWQTDYDLTLTYHLELVEVMYLCGDFDQMETVAEIVLQQARTHLDKVKVYEIRVQAYMGQTQYLKALQTVRNGLALFEVKFPAKPTEADIVAALTKTISLWQGQPISELINLPPMTAAHGLATMRLLSISIPPTYLGMPELFPLVVSNMINLSIEHGNSELSPFAYASYGLILCNSMEIEDGYQFGQLAIQVTEQLKFQIRCAMTFDMIDTFINPWKKHLSETGRHLIEVYQIGIGEGDLEFAAHACLTHCEFAYFIGQPLVELENRQTFYLRELAQWKQDNCVKYLTIYQQSILSLLREVPPSVSMVNIAEESQKLLDALQQHTDYYGLFLFYANRLSLGYFFCEPLLALENAILAKNYLAGAAGHASVALFHFYESLSYLAIYLDTPAARREEILQQVSANQEKMKHWAHHAPMNFQHKYDLVEAEKARVLGQNWEAAAHYEKAITGARENQYLQEEALAYELAAKFYLGQGMSDFAQTYLTKAYQRYQRWGALAKLKHLEQQHPQWLPPKQKFATEMATHTATVLPTSRMATTRFATGTDWLDLVSVMKAAQVLSGEIVLENLLDKLMRIVIENAGAQRGFLLLPQAEHWFIEAQGAVDQEEVTVLQSLPIDTHLPETIINYVTRTLDKVVLTEARRDGRYAAHPYIQTHQIQSVLCFPIVYQQQLRAILYLENNLTPGAFTPDRLQVLKMLSGQIAISLENAQVMAHLDAKVKERTAQLNAKIEELTHTRQELVQSEKMASLGRLVAGFAHELNTPLGVALGSASVLQREAQKIHRLMAQEEVDVDELLSAVTSVEDGFTLTLSNLERAANLVTSFKRTAVDQTSGEVRTFRVLEVIEDTINTLHNRFKPTGIKIQVTCPQELKVNSLPGALEQILTNLLMNSLIHGFDEGQRAGQIQLVVRLQETQLHLEYSDNGKGIASENLAKIFEPFFTTHRAHGGSGLGMYICYNLVTTQLQGTLTVDSVLGQGVIFRIDYPVLVG